jgi:glutamate synthase domain-containing protein 3
LLTRHRDLTGSPRAAWLLENWKTVQPRFIKVYPHEYKRVLGVARAAEAYSPAPKSTPLVAAGQVQHG